MRQFTTAAALFLAASLYPDIDSNRNLEAGERIAVSRDDTQFFSRVTLTAKNGRVAWADVLRGVARARGYDDRCLEGTLPCGSMKLNGHMARLMLAGADRLFGDGVAFRIHQPATRNSQPQLVIEMDHEKVLASQRRVKQQLRDKLLPKSYTRKDYGIRVHERSLATKNSDHMVVFIHGLNSHPATVRHLADVAQQNGLACAEFSYPNDQAIEASGRMLAMELKRWRKSHPQQRISLVTHSMGGIVARYALETPGMDAGNVDRLVMVAPPNQGCQLAQFAFGMDLWEYMDGHDLQDRRCIFYSSIEDGLSEATVDLQPGSIFLTKLNRRQRNPNVAYSIFLGTGAPCTREDLEGVRRHVAKLSSTCPWVKFLGSRVDSSIADMDEVVNGAGDGAVAVKRGRLAGVEDTNVIDFGHLNVLHDTSNPEVRKLYDEVLKRLKDA